LVFERSDGQFLAANEAAVLLLGYASEGFAALTPSDIHPHEIPRLEAFLAPVQAHGRWVGDDLSCRTTQGRHVPAELRASAIELDARHSILAIVRDRRRNTLASAQVVADGASHPDRLVAQRADVIFRSMTVDEFNRGGDVVIEIVDAPDPS
jgi:PAS domain S-box-containing protein